MQEFGSIVGQSAALRRTLDTAIRAAATKAPVLITGESGTGKELIAQALHGNGARASRAFVAVNCGALPPDLLESELFGHERGAFTHAIRARQGRFALADGGSIFLDEVGEMSPALQVKLLRVLQDGVFEPVGSSESRRVDVRTIAATNRDLEEALRNGAFREDLYYRLNVIPIEVPPLRERRDDVLVLIDHFLQRVCHRTGKHVEGFTTAALARLCAYPWPGNVRELQNLIERLVILGDGGWIDVDALPDPYAAPGGFRIPTAPRLPQNGITFRDEVARFEANLLQQALERTDWNKTKAAALLGLNRTTLLEMIRARGIEPPEPEPG